MDVFFNTLTGEQRNAFLNAFLATLTLDQLIYIRDNVVDAHVVLKGGHSKPKMSTLISAVPARRRFWEIQINNVPIGDNDDYRDARQHIIDLMGRDAVSTHVHVDADSNEAFIRFDDRQCADLAFERLRKVYPEIRYMQ